MRRMLHITGRLLLALLLVSLVGGLIGMALLGYWHPDVEIHVGDGLSTMTDLDGQHWLLGAGALALALFIVLTVVPLSLLFAAAVTAGSLGVVALVLLALAAFMLSPVLLVAALLWWALRRRRADTDTAAGVAS
jgi:hypothetical protein